MKKIKKIILQMLLYTICYRNVDKFNSVWIFTKYNLLGGEMIGIVVLIVIGIICLGICYIITNSILATTVYGAYIGLIIITFSLFVLTN